MSLVGACRRLRERICADLDLHMERGQMKWHIPP